MYVLAFDRDWTVDVNPHPRREAVPLEWVRFWAHETDHEVWAIGNQDLVEEAGIPGTVESIRRGDGTIEALGERDERGRYEWWPGRGERLRILADLFPEAERYVVVDDLDLGHVEGWDHYYAWDFVDAVREGEIDLSLPVRTDGGHDGDEDDDPPFEYATEERRATYPDEGYALVEIDTMKPPGEALTKLAEYDSLVAIDMPPATDLVDYVVYDSEGRAYTHDDLLSDPTEELRDAARRRPDSVDVGEIVDVVESGDSGARREALLALDDLIDARPGDALDLLPLLADCLESDDRLVRAATLSCLAGLAEEYPTQVAPAADGVVALLDPNTDGEFLEAAVPYVAAVAEKDPSAVLGAVPKLAALLGNDPPCEGKVVVALARISEAYPESVLPVTGDLLSYVEDEDGSHRVATLAALGYVSKAYPNVAESAIPTLIELLDADAYRLRANAAGLLANLTDEYPGAVRPAVGRVIELLDDHDEKVRYNATSILAKLAKTCPGAVEPAVDPLIDALDEEFEYARSNACWALGYLEATAARDALREAKRSDPDEEVRNAAGCALRQIEGTDG